jgi:hypothetical protein
MKHFIKKLLRENLLYEENQLDTDLAEPKSEKPEDSRVPNIPTTEASFFTVRFNLDNIKDNSTKKKIYLTWKVEPNGKTGPLGDDKLDFNPSDLVDVVNVGGVRNNFDPSAFSIQMTDCSLINPVNRAYSIYKGDNKVPITKIRCSEVSVSSKVRGAGSKELIYNPKVAPYWRMKANDVFQELDYDIVKLGDKVPDYKEGVVYMAPITPVKFGPAEGDFYKSRFFAVKLGDEIYIKEVRDGEGVDNYKTNGATFLDVDNKTFAKLYTSGRKIYEG